MYVLHIGKVCLPIIELFWLEPKLPVYEGYCCTYKGSMNEHEPNCRWSIKRTWNNHVVADGAETAAIDELVSSWSENISVSFSLRAAGYGLTLWYSLGLLVAGAIKVPQLQLLLLFAGVLHVVLLHYDGISRHIYCVVDGYPQRRVEMVAVRRVAMTTASDHCVVLVVSIRGRVHTGTGVWRHQLPGSATETATTTRVSGTAGHHIRWTAGRCPWSACSCRSLTWQRSCPSDICTFCFFLENLSGV